MTTTDSSHFMERLTKLVTAASPLILALSTLVAAIASSAALIIGAINTAKINEVHVLTNSLATRTEALARKAGMAEGELKGRADQKAEETDK